MFVSANPQKVPRLPYSHIFSIGPSLVLSQQVRGVPFGGACVPAPHCMCVFTPAWVWWAGGACVLMNTWIFWGAFFSSCSGLCSASELVQHPLWGSVYPSAWPPARLFPWAGSCWASWSANFLGNSEKYGVCLFSPGAPGSAIPVATWSISRRGKMWNGTCLGYLWGARPQGRGFAWWTEPTYVSSSFTNGLSNRTDV